MPNHPESTNTAALIPSDENPSPIGHNTPPGLMTAEELVAHFFGANGEPGIYNDLDNEITSLLRAIGGRDPSATPAPARVETDADNGIIASYMGRLRTTLKNTTAFRAKEKAPYLKAERFIDNSFGELEARLEKTRDILQARGDDYTARKAAEERVRRNREAAAAAEAERAAAAEAERLRQEAAATAAAAERARKPENIEKLEQKAEGLDTQAALAQVDHMMATGKADTAMVAAAQPTAEIVRTRFAAGNMATGKQVPFVQITDDTKLDMAKLWPHLPLDAKEKALKAWAKSTGHKIKMDGAIIEMRDKADYRA